MNSLHDLISLRPISILFSHPRLGLSSNLLSSAFETEVSYVFLQHFTHANCHAYLTLLDFNIKNTCYYNFVYFSVTFLVRKREERERVSE